MHWLACHSLPGPTGASASRSGEASTEAGDPPRQVTLDVAVARGATGNEVWRHEGLHLTERFLASLDPNVYESNKEQALRRLTAEIAGRIHDELFQKF